VTTIAAMAKWTAGDIGDQSGRTFVVTGANSGLGASTARALAARGATVVLACRNVAKAEAAARTMPGDVRVEALDLASLASVREFADRVPELDVLINNAGVMAVPYGRTADGFEMQIGTNFLGHFALTGLLLDGISSRVVTLSSNAHKMGRIDLADLNWERRRYQRWGAYAQSKLADLVFAFELQRRLTAAGSSVLSVAAHPGYASTELQSHTESWQDQLMKVGNWLVGQSADMGALPSLYAAVASGAQGGTYYGPDRLAQMRGYPRAATSTRSARDAELGRRLWEQAEKLTGVSYP
jgi:NAD(P)-dependent dehydrogenase (short-subunit alcohol dehydrogenase family)